jgi:Arc/MetJ-type ribon-helix-helix transcriptional regulator
VESLVLLGYYPSRSEAFRVAIKQFLDREAEMNKGLDKEIFTELKTLQMEKMIHQ